MFGFVKASCLFPELCVLHMAPLERASVSDRWAVAGVCVFERTDSHCVTLRPLSLSLRLEADSATRSISCVCVRELHPCYSCLQTCVFKIDIPAAPGLNRPVSVLYVTWLAVAGLAYVCVKGVVKIALFNPSGLNRCRHNLNHLNWAERGAVEAEGKAKRGCEGVFKSKEPCDL